MKQLSILVSSGWLVWRRLGLHGLTLLALVWLAPGLEVAASGTPVTVPFDTPNSYEWTVPDGLTSITVEAWGAQGGTGVANTGAAGLGGLCQRDYRGDAG